MLSEANDADSLLKLYNIELEEDEKKNTFVQIRPETVKVIDIPETKHTFVQIRPEFLQVVNDNNYIKISEFIIVKLNYHKQTSRCYNTMFVLLGIFNILFNVFFIIQLFYEYVNFNELLSIVIINLINSSMFVFINPSKLVEQHKLMFNRYEELMNRLQLETYKKEDVIVHTKQVLDQFNKINSISLLF